MTDGDDPRPSSWPARAGREIRRLGRTVHAVLSPGDHRAGAAYWGDTANLSRRWDARTEQLAALVPPGTTVLEFGAGRLALPQYLPPDCAHIPSDIVDRGPGTLVCDLNDETLPDLPRHDVALFSGVLEYVHDLERMAGWLHAWSPTVITSYAVRDRPSIQSRRKRRRHGWVNDCTRDEIEAVFTRAGYTRTALVVLGRQHLFVFRRRDEDPGA